MWQAQNVIMEVGNSQITSMLRLNRKQHSLFCVAGVRGVVLFAMDNLETISEIIAKNQIVQWYEIIANNKNKIIYVYLSLSVTVYV